jgi:predicted RecA/RadA family phage recombinase
MGAVLYHSADQRQVTAGANLNSGNIVLSADGKAMVITAFSGVDSGRIARGPCSGVYEVDAITTDTWTAGALVYLTESTQVAATTSGAGKILIGTAAYAKVSGPAVVYVDLNGTRTSVDDHS